MTLSHSVSFEFDIELSPQKAVAFVQDVGRSLGKATFLNDLQVMQQGLCHRVCASIPINAALFGQRQLAFESLLTPTLQGATLVALPVREYETGWAEVSGKAAVAAREQGSRVSYHFDIAIHLDLPEPEKWGGKALLKMVHFTAQRVLERVAAEFPRAVQTAAVETEAVYSRS